MDLGGEDGGMRARAERVEELGRVATLRYRSWLDQGLLSGMRRELGSGRKEEWVRMVDWDERGGVVR